VSEGSWNNLKINLECFLQVSLSAAFFPIHRKKIPKKNMRLHNKKQLSFNLKSEKKLKFTISKTIQNNQNFKSKIQKI
jgi:hypothetical protein